MVFTFRFQLLPKACEVLLIWACYGDVKPRASELIVNVAVFLLFALHRKRIAKGVSSKSMFIVNKTP